MKRCQRGFTLLEILIVVALLAVVYAIIPSGAISSSRENLEENIQKIVRGIRFAQNESILRNSIVRLHLSLTGEDNQSYSIDFAPSDTLPLPELQDVSKLSIKEREEQQKILDNVDRQFSPLPELEDEDLNFPDQIVIQGVGLADKDIIQTEGGYSLYFYPTGEKDSAIIFISSIEELAVIQVEAFASEPDIRYYKLENDSMDYLEKEIKKHYDQWRDN